MTSNEKKKLWNEAVSATLIELRKYDGVIKSPIDREFLTNEIFKIVAYKEYPHKFKKIKY